MQFLCFTDMIYISLFIVSGIAYVLRYELHEKNPPETMFAAYDKAFPIMLLAAYVNSMKKPDTNHRNEPEGFYNFMLGLMLSSLGDVCLIFPKTLFIPGIVVFMVAHLSYSYAFGTYIGTQFMQIVFVLLWMAGFIFIQLNINTFMMQIIFMAYSCLLFYSAWRATARCESQQTIGAFVASLGTILFISSHSLIAINIWVFPVAMCEFLVTVSYYGAQLGIVLCTNPSLSVTAI